jgi:hypothetical protein
VVDSSEVALQALGVMTALAVILSIRLSLILAILGSVGLTLYAEVQHSTVAVVAAAIFTLVGLVPLVALAYRKG